MDNDDEAETDIVSALESSSAKDQGQHLATKKTRIDAQLTENVKEAEQDVKKRANFQRAFDRV